MFVSTVAVSTCGQSLHTRNLIIHGVMPTHESKLVSGSPGSGGGALVFRVGWVVAACVRNGCSPGRASGCRHPGTKKQLHEMLCNSPTGLAVKRLVVAWAKVQVHHSANFQGHFRPGLPVVRWLLGHPPRHPAPLADFIPRACLLRPALALAAHADEHIPLPLYFVSSIFSIHFILLLLVISVKALPSFY